MRRLINTHLDSDELEETVASRRHRRQQIDRALPDLECSTATPSRSSSNQQSRRNSHQLEEFFTIEHACPKVHAEKHRPFKRRVGDIQGACSGEDDRPSVFPSLGMARGMYSESEGESDHCGRSLCRSSSLCSAGRGSSLGSAGRGSSLGSAGRMSSSAYESSLAPCASAASSATPRYRRPRSSSVSSQEGCCIDELRDRLLHHMNGSPLPPHHELPRKPKGSRRILPPPGTPVRPSSRAATCSADGLCRAGSRCISPSSLMRQCSDDSLEAGWHSSRRARYSSSMAFPPEDVLSSSEDPYAEDYGVTLPSLTHSESAPLLKLAPIVTAVPSQKSETKRGGLGNRLQEASVEKEDGLNVMELGPLNVTGAANARRPKTAWGTGRSRRSVHDGRRISDGEAPRPQQDGWHLSLCQNVAIHLPASLPSKDAFAQRKVPRPVSPSPREDSHPASPAAGEGEDSRVPFLHAGSIEDLLQNMRRMSDSSSSVDSNSDCRSKSAEPVVDLI